MQNASEATSTASVSRLHAYNVSLTRSTMGDSTKQSSLSSVSPTSSLRDLTMRSLSSHSSSSEDHFDSTVEPLASRQQSSSSRRRWSPPSNRAAAASNLNNQLAVDRPAAAKVSFTDSQSDELKHIQDSVERLRAQRTHVEQLRHRNDRLERLLSERTHENEKLRRQVASMQGVDQENVGLLKSFQLLEERIRVLEMTCQERKEEAKLAIERLAATDKARDSLQLRVDELSVEREHLRKQLSVVHSTHEKRIKQLQSAHEEALETSRRVQSEWQLKLHGQQQAQSHVERQFQDEMAQLRRESQTLVRENREMEQRVQQLLTTTVRQTTMIEDCDRLLSESKARHETAKASYRNQLQLNSSLHEQAKQLELKLSAWEQRSVSEKTTHETKALELETKLHKFKDKVDVYAVALREKENHCEKLQNELLVRDRARLHVDDVVKELRHKEKTLLSEISGFKVALSDMADEKNILQDQLRGLHEQLENERKDRSRWATARLKLLAEFCDEETKLSSALHHYAAVDMMVDEGSEGLDDAACVDVMGGGEEDSVDATVLAASAKKDAMQQHLHRRRKRPPPTTSNSIVFG